MVGSGIGVIPKGTTGTVVDSGIFGTQSGIEWDINIGGHGCDGNCEYGFGWYVPDEYLSQIDISGKDMEYEILPLDSLLSAQSQLT